MGERGTSDWQSCLPHSPSLELWLAEQPTRWLQQMPRVKWVSPDPNVQPLIIKLMGNSPWFGVLDTMETPFLSAYPPDEFSLPSPPSCQWSSQECPGPRHLQNSVANGTRWVSATEKAQIHWSAFWRKKCISGTEANNSQPIYTVAIVLARKKKEKGRERDKINFSSDVTSAK